MTWIRLKTKMSSKKFTVKDRSCQPINHVATGFEQLRDQEFAVIRRMGHLVVCKRATWAIGSSAATVCESYGWMWVRDTAFILLSPKTASFLLLCGDKQSQASDIDKAVRFWDDWQRRQDDEK